MEAPVPLCEPPCPVCGGDTHRTVLRGARDHVWRKPGVFQLQACEGCGLVSTRPRPVADALGFYYENAYSGEDGGGMREFQTESWLGKLISGYRLAVIERTGRLGEADHVLDVGCSYGGFLRFMREARGVRTSGIDLDAGSIESAVDRAQTDYHVGLLSEADLPDGGYTLITFMESLEHHTEPVEALRKAHALLAPGGRIAVEVPNYGGLWRRVFGTSWLPLLIPQHLFHFTPGSLRRALRAAGFTRVERHQTMFYPLEGVASLGIWLARILRSPPPGAPPSWRTPFDLAILLVLVALYFVVEIPSQWLLRLAGLAGHQLVVARRE